jgi:hypothetical protein
MGTNFVVGSWDSGRSFGFPLPLDGQLAGVPAYAWSISFQFGICVMHAVVFASGAALSLCVTLPALAAQHNIALNLKPDASFNTKWDQCEALARQRGTPPGKIGYGDFIDDCSRNIPPNHTRVALRRVR